MDGWLLIIVLPCFTHIGRCKRPRPYDPAAAAAAAAAAAVVTDPPLMLQFQLNMISFNAKIARSSIDIGMLMGKSSIK